MIEIKIKGFKLDIPKGQIVTFKKSQNLNGIQSRYSYSNTITLDKTANNKKLLGLFDLPTSKTNSLKNSIEIDAVINQSINLNNQILKIQKETLTKVEVYILYSNTQLTNTLKSTLVNDLVKEYVYKKTIPAFIQNQSITQPLEYKSIFLETQEKSGFYVVEEMPLALQVQNIIRKFFLQNNYSVFGSFFEENNEVAKYYIAPNKGVYQVYSAGDGFAPTFDDSLTAFNLLDYCLKFFNCYVDVDDTYKTVNINNWNELNNYKINFKDYSDYFINYSDYFFDGKLSKKNELTYSDSGSTFNSFFTSNYSEKEKETYLASEFGSGTLNLFEDSEIDEATGLLEVRNNGDAGETSAIRIFKISESEFTYPIYQNGTKQNVTARKAKPISMFEVYQNFHKNYIDFILTPLICNFDFRYDAIFVNEFSMNRVFFVEQLASYWIPLEINFSTKKDKVSVKAMMVKKKISLAPKLNNFNSIILDFKEKGLFEKLNLLSMYASTNEYEFYQVVFKSYNENFNKLFVNDIFVPAASLPQVFLLSEINTIKIEANKNSDTVPDKNTDSLYIQAIDSNGGISNDAYINIKHTGIASLESNFIQNSDITYSRSGFDSGERFVNPFNYILGNKPNLNNTIISVSQILKGGGDDEDFDLVTTNQVYNKIDFVLYPCILTLNLDNNGLGRAKGYVLIYLKIGSQLIKLYENTASNNDNKTFQIPQIKRSGLNVPSNTDIRLFVYYRYFNRKNLGSIDVNFTVSNFKLDIKSIIQI